MTPAEISRRVVVDRLDLIAILLAGIRVLPLDDRAAFFVDPRNTWAAESCLRRSLEALLDIGRHILAKGFGIGASEYKEIPLRLHEQAVLTAEEATLMRLFAGYRNRLVHFYHEVSPEELYDICVHHLSDIERLQDAYRRWLNEHPEKLDSHL